MRPRIAHGLFTWQDGRVALEAALRSTAGHVDEVLIADGLINGVDPGGLPPFSDLAWFDDDTTPDWLPARVPVSARPWQSLSQACTWLLDKARELDCDWLLTVDADQELHGGEWLRDTLAAYQGEVAYPILRADRTLHHCPWQCVRVSAIRRYIAGCFVVELTDGQVISLAPNNTPGLPASVGPLHRGVWISHHPERRPPGRHAHRLGNLETVLEPPPLDIPCLRVPERLLHSATMGSETHYCDQCGERYQGPGVCDNSHPPAELTPLAAKKPAAKAKAPTKSASPAKK